LKVLKMSKVVDPTWNRGWEVHQWLNSLQHASGKNSHQNGY